MDDNEFVVEQRAEGRGQRAKGMGHGVAPHGGA